MTQQGSGLAALSGLDDPVRARLYQFVSESTEPVGRDEAAAAIGIGRALAAYHLDKLVGLGLLTASYQRAAGRTGPGAGRPAKIYTRSGREFSVTVPPRDYELAAHLLASAVESDRGGLCREALRDAAREFGADLGRHCLAGLTRSDSARQSVEIAQSLSSPSPTQGSPSPTQGSPSPTQGSPSPTQGVPSPTQGSPSALRIIESALRDHGFEPCRDDDGTVLLRNCPFHQLASQHPDVVCGMSLALIEGLVAALGASGGRAALDPRPGRCCVVIGTVKPASER